MWHLNCFKYKVSLIWYIGKESLIALKDCNIVVPLEILSYRWPDGKQVSLCYHQLWTTS